MSDITERLRARRVTRWVHATGQAPQASGYSVDAECQEAADAIESLRREVHNLNWALGTTGYEAMATPEEQAEADAAHASALQNIERMNARKKRWDALLPDGQDPLDAIESRDATIAELRAEVAVLQMACSRWEQALKHGADRIRKAENEADELRAQVQALKPDAERFQTLIDTAPGCLCFMGQEYRTADAFRAAIDAARSQEDKG